MFRSAIGGTRVAHAPFPPAVPALRAPASNAMRRPRDPGLPISKQSRCGEGRILKTPPRASAREGPPMKTDLEVRIHEPLPRASAPPVSCDQPLGDSMLKFTPIILLLVFRCEPHVRSGRASYSRRIVRVKRNFRRLLIFSRWFLVFRRKPKRLTSTRGGVSDACHEPS
jgi:hypothetical protein